MPKTKNKKLLKNNVDKAEKIIIKAEQKVEKKIGHLENKIDETINKLSRVGLHEYATYLSHPWRIFWSNLLAGTARGLGFLFGVTIIIAIISYVVTMLVDLPIVGEFFGNLNEFLQQNING